ncbi:hypothetical protein DFS34DRAFT_413881 [Phlyctochytrium arcticum]|nr:hypothetical protein DFS34DRAFT_413881 [Phlyctochytrium arcticum]
MTSPTPVRQDGIRNAGQTCYMGSVLQMLYFCPFKDSMQKLFPMSENGKPPIITALCKIFRTRDQHKLVSIDALKKQLGAVAPRFADDHQEDAQEFLSELLSEVNRECILGSSLKAPTPVDSTFMWSVKKTFMCEQCPSQSSTTETYSTLPLDFGERPPGMTDPGVSPSPRARQRHGLHSLVANFFKEELVDRTCEKCGCTKAKTLSRIETLPRVMIIHLKRFQLDTATSRIRKREDLVDVPLRLNMGMAIRALSVHLRSDKHSYSLTQSHGR